MAMIHKRDKPTYYKMEQEGTMIREIIEVGGQRWLVEARSMKDALGEIGFARCTGSIGSRSEIDSTLCGGGIELRADVRRLGPAE